MLGRLQRLLGEPVMGFLALLAIALGVAPLAFHLTTGTERILDALDWAVVALFALEYGVNLALAPSKRAFAANPWHILDLVIVVAPLATLLPWTSEALRSSPALRLIRLARVALFGARTGGAIRHEVVEPEAPATRAPLEIRVLRASEPGEAGAVLWPEFLQLLADPAEEWFHLSGVQPEDFERIAGALGVPPVLVRSKLVDGSNPRVDLYERFLTLFVWYPQVRPGHIERSGTLVVGAAQNLVTLSREPSDLHDAMARILRTTDLQAPFLVRATYALLKHLLGRYEGILEGLEREVHHIEDLPIRHSDQALFERTFHLKRQIRAVSSDLWHVKGLVRAFADNRVPLQGFSTGHQGLFEVLADEADYLYETARNALEHLLSLIELRLNVVSLEMNKVMRILALVTAMALIPTVVGGLLGMNLAGNPWPVSLSHVAFGVGAGMALCLYIFAIKGWLR